MFTPLVPSFLGSPKAGTSIKTMVFDVSPFSQSFMTVALTANPFVKKNISKQNTILAKCGFNYSIHCIYAEHTFLILFKITKIIQIIFRSET